MYPTIMDCDSKCLALLIHSTYDCAQRSAFISVLAQLCFIFSTIDSIENDTDFITELVDGATSNKFLSVLQTRFGNSNHDRSTIIKSSFYDVKRMSTKRKCKITKKQESKFYRVVVASTFYEHLEFTGQESLVLEVFG